MRGGVSAAAATGRRGWLLVLVGLWLLGTAGGVLAPVVAAWVVHHESASWSPLACTIDSARMFERSKGGSRSGSTWAVEAHYHYEVGGRTYRGAVVDHLPSYSDRRAVIQKHRFAPLEQALAAGTPHLGWVDPEDPTRAVLFRDLPPYAYMTPLLCALLGWAGVRLFVSGVLARRKAHRRVRLANECADRPWMVDDLWHGFATRSNPERLFGPWLGAAYFTTMAAIFVSLCFERHAKPAGLVLTAGMVAVSLGLLARTIYHTARHLKWGPLRLAVSRMPTRPGELLEGLVTCGRRVEAQDGFSLALRCVQHVGRKRLVRWEGGGRVTQDLLGALDADGTMIPVRLQVPADQPPTDLREPPLVSWELEVRSDTPGVDLRATFEVPIYACPDERVERRA